MIYIYNKIFMIFYFMMKSLDLYYV